MLTDTQESNLTSAGDCFEHYHSSDRIPTHEAYTRMLSLESFVAVTSGASVVRSDVDYVLADSTAGVCTLTLPNVSRNGSITVVKVSALNTVVIQAAVGLINGAATYVLAAAYSHAKLKALGGNYYVVG